MSLYLKYNFQTIKETDLKQPIANCFIKNTKRIVTSQYKCRQTVHKLYNIFGKLYKFFQN